MRAFATVCGRKSRSHICGRFFDFHEPKAWPASPVTAMMLPEEINFVSIYAIGQFLLQKDVLYMDIVAVRQWRDAQKISIDFQMTGIGSKFLLENHLEFVDGWRMLKGGRDNCISRGKS